MQVLFKYQGPWLSPALGLTTERESDWCTRVGKLASQAAWHREAGLGGPASLVNAFWDSVWWFPGFLLCGLLCNSDKDGRGSFTGILTYSDMKGSQSSF